MKHLVSCGALGLAALVAAPAFGQSTTDNAVFDPSTNRTYRLHTSDLNWIGAHNAATAAGWNLASIGSAAENTKAAGLTGGDAWIGYTDNEMFPGASEAGSNPTVGWVWTDGSPVTYTNWGGGEPNDHPPGEDATHIRNDNMWNDHQSGIGAETGSPNIDSVWERAGNFATSVDFNGHRYTLIAPATYNDAEAAAVAMGGHLASIGDAAENAAVAALVGGLGSLWIGFDDQATEGTFAWTDGSAVGYTNWNGGEPNDAGGNEDATEIGANGGWNDIPVGELRVGVAEVVIPEPASLSLLALGGLGLLARRRRA